MFCKKFEEELISTCALYTVEAIYNGDKSTQTTVNKQEKVYVNEERMR